MILLNKTNLLWRNIKIFPVISRCIHNFNLGKIRYITVAKKILVHLNKQTANRLTLRCTKTVHMSTGNIKLGIADYLDGFLPRLAESPSLK